MDFTCGALFAGIGGFCLGFESAQFKTSWAIEQDSYACNTYRKNLPNINLITSDVREVSPTSTNLEPVDVLHAGFPCQSFSQAGGRAGFNDARGRLFFEIIRIIESFKDKRPKVLAFENAPFIRYGDGGAWFLTIKSAIQRAGYWFGEANSKELDAFTLTALPQQRKRLFMVALSTKHFKSGKFDFPEDLHDQPKSFANYIDFSASVPNDYYLSSENKYAKMIGKVTEDRDVLYQLRKYEVRAKPRNLCPTLTANMGLGGHNVPFIYTPYGLRKLTEYECLRLQGFPASFEFPESVPRARRYTQIGNAVAVPVAQLLAKSIYTKLMVS